MIIAASHVAQTNVNNWTLRNPEGSLPAFTFELLKSSYEGDLHGATIFAHAKLRHWGAPLDSAVPMRDLVLHRLLLPDAAPDVFLSADTLWAAVDQQLAWQQVSHLAVIITVWAQDCISFQRFIRQSAEFAQGELADRYGVGVHLVAHDPRRIGHGADPHVHLMCTARQLTSGGLGTFVHELLHTGCQTRIKAAWDAWRLAHP